MYMFARSIDFAPFYDSSMGIWNFSDSSALFVFFILLYMYKIVQIYLTICSINK